MTSVIVTSNRMRIIRPSGSVVFDTDEPLLNCVYRSGSIALPQRQASTLVAGTTVVINQTDVYDLSAVPSDATTVVGMFRLVLSATPELAINAGRWLAYSGETPTCIWAHYPQYSPGGGVSNIGFYDDFVQQSSFATVRFSVESGRLVMRDRLLLRAPASFVVNSYRTRPAGTLDYRLYIGRFS